MFALELDFVARRSRSRWLGTALLALAVAFAADVSISYVSLRGKIQEGEARLARQGRTLEGERPGAVPGVSAEEMRAARETIERLSLSWDNLFSALESSPGGQVALLSIEPDARAGTALISGEAADYAAALQYVAGLGAARTLRNVHLVRHEMREGGSRRPLAFSVSATWKEAR